MLSTASLAIQAAYTDLHIYGYGPALVSLSCLYLALTQSFTSSHRRAIESFSTVGSLLSHDKKSQFQSCLADIQEFIMMSSDSSSRN